MSWKRMISERPGPATPQPPDGRARPRAGRPGRGGVRPRRRRHARGPGERGAALLIVIWIFIVLFVVVLDFAASMRDDGLATANFADETRAYYIALGGLNRAVYDVLVALEENPDVFDDFEDDEEDEEDDDEEDEGADEEDEEDEDAEEEYEELGDLLSSTGSWEQVDFGDGWYQIRLLDESGKLSLNRASDALLTRVVTRLLVGGNATEGVSVNEQREIETVVHSILDWRDPDDLEHLNGAEASYYNSLRRPYPIKNGPFDSVDELLLVKGVTPELYYGAVEGVGLRDVFSVFNHSPKVNVMRASAPVLRVLFDVDEEGAEELLEERETESFGFLTRMRERMMAVDPELAAQLRGGMSPMVTVEAHGAVGDRPLARIAAIVDVSDSFDGARVFRWFDRVPAGWNPGSSEEDADDEEEGF
jgi:general secretion pathway protein K